MDEAIKLSDHLDRYIPGCRTTAMALGYYLLLNAWPEKVAAFHDALAEGIGLTKTSPILRLRNILVQGARQTSSSDRRKVLALFLKAFNYWVDGEEREILVWRTDETWPVPYTAESHRRKVIATERALKGAETKRRQAQSA